MIKVCHMTSAHDRYDVRIFEKECSSLAKYGYEVSLVVNDNIKNEIKDNVNIVTTGFVSKNRLQRMIFSTKEIYKKAIELNCDIYHFHDPELLPIGHKLKKLGKKVIFDSHEDVAKQIMDKTWIPKLFRKIISLIYAGYEKKIVKSIDAVISVSPQFIEVFAKYNTNATLITNYPIIAINNEVQSKPESFICFAGGISKQWNHEKIIEAISNIEGLRYIIAGSIDNSYMEYLQTISGWGKVDYLGVISHEDVQKLYAKSMIGVAINFSNQIKGIGTLGNTKLFEFMEAKLPVVCSDYVLWKEVIDKYKCGICVNPQNTKEIEKALRYLVDNPQEAIAMGENGRKAVEKQYNWKVEEKKLIALYQNIE